MIILLHFSYINTKIENKFENIIQSLISLFVGYEIFKDLFLHARLIDKMDRRASQPLNHLLPQQL